MRLMGKMQSRRRQKRPRDLGAPAVNQQRVSREQIRIGSLLLSRVVDLLKQRNWPSSWRSRSRRRNPTLNVLFAWRLHNFIYMNFCNLMSIIGGNGANIWLPQSVPLNLLLLQVKARDDRMPTVQVVAVNRGKMIILTGFCNQSDELIRSEISNQPGF